LFWNNVKWRNLNFAADGAGSKHGYLNINPEGVLLRESQDIAEELGISKELYFTFDQWAYNLKFLSQHSS
jgi:hypothetical protein